jgi:hypothetical protein
MRDRIIRWAQDKPYVEARPAFNVESFLHLGNFFAAVDGEGIVLRLAEADHREALALQGARAWRAGPPGRPAYAWIPNAAVASDPQLHAWLEKALQHAAKLPPKDRLLTKGVHVPEWKRGGPGERG